MKPDGGPAFPSGGMYATRWEGYLGLSLRDYFAAAALFGIHSGMGESAEKIATFSYQVADAMLAERVQK